MNQKLLPSLLLGLALATPPAQAADAFERLGEALGTTADTAPDVWSPRGFLAAEAELQKRLEAVTADGELPRRNDPALADFFAVHDQPARLFQNLAPGDTHSLITMCSTSADIASRYMDHGIPPGSSALLVALRNRQNAYKYEPEVASQLNFMLRCFNEAIPKLPASFQGSRRQQLQDSLGHMLRGLLEMLQDPGHSEGAKRTMVQALHDVLPVYLRIMRPEQRALLREQALAARNFLPAPLQARFDNATTPLAR